MNSSVMRSSQPICVTCLVNVLIFSAYLFWLEPCLAENPTSDTMLYGLVSQQGEHMVNKYILMSPAQSLPQIFPLGATNICKIMQAKNEDPGTKNQFTFVGLNSETILIIFR